MFIQFGLLHIINLQYDLYTASKDQSDEPDSDNANSLDCKNRLHDFFTVVAIAFISNKRKDKPESSVERTL